MADKSLRLHDVSPGEIEYQDALQAQFVSAFPDYAPLFPAIRQEIQKGVERSDEILPHYWLILKDDQPVGVALSRYLIKSNIGFFRYLGVDPAQRGLGIGSFVIEELKKQFCLDAETYNNPEPLGYCQEVENPQYSTDETERQIDQLRLDYFINRGIIVLPVEYYEPVILEKEKHRDAEPKPMHLLLQPIGNKPVHIDSETTRKLVCAVWFEHYGIDPNNSTVQEMLNSIPDTEV